MGFFSKTVSCPSCGLPGAEKSFWKIRCLNAGCENYQAMPAKQIKPKKILTGDFKAGEDQITIHYRNYEGEEKDFIGDRSTIRVGKKHISLLVEPKGQRITLAKVKIKNLQEVEHSGSQQIAATLSKLTAKERQVVGYHKKNKTTSPLYEEIRRNHPQI